jgi:uncharacterized protein YegJ (DUF2314 family)
VKQKSFTLLAAGIIALTAVCPALADHPIARQNVKPGVEPQYFDVVQHKRAMRQAVHQARRTVGVFIQAVQKPSPGQYDFQVKKPFRQGLVTEHIWLTKVTFSGNRFHGYVDNQPRKIKGLKFGQRVSVNPNEISDWAFIQNGRLIGGYTIRVLYMELPPAGKAALRREANFRIGA